MFHHRLRLADKRGQSIKTPPRVLSHSGIAVCCVGFGELAPEFARGRALRLGWTRHLPLRRTGRRRLADIEFTEHLCDPTDFLNQRVAGGRGLFHHRSVLLRALVHGIDGCVDLLKCCRLFAGGIHDGTDMPIDLLDLIDDDR